MEQLKRIGRELVYKGSILDMYQDSIQTPNGNIAKWDFLSHKGAAAVVPVKEDGTILLVRQYRNALDRYTIEIPAGCLNGVNEPTMTCAARELEEETGYRSSDLEFLVSINTSVAFCDEKIDIYVARNLIESKQNLDEDEFVEVLEYDKDTLLEMIYKCEIRDAKTIAGLLAYFNKYCTDK